MSDPRATRRWKTARKMAFNRDAASNAVCHLCHGEEWDRGPIDYDAPAGSPLAWEGDHVLDVRDYPHLAYDLTNIAASHAACNRSRRSMSVEAYKRRMRVAAAKSEPQTGSQGVGRTTRKW